MTPVRRYVDRVVLVTGAGQGLGAAMAQRFAVEGATVAIADIDPATATEIAAAMPDGRGAAWTVDVTDPGQVSAWVADVLASHGRIDVLVNNAGIIRDNRIENISADDWDAVLSVNLSGAFHCAQTVFPHMKERGYGRILSFSSMSWRGNFGQANYVAAKAGVVGLARALALEGARHGITSNAIAPGLIDTPMLASMNAAAREKLTGKIPVGKTGTPADIAAAAAFICSAEAGYITGTVIDVDGGIGIGSSLR
jgi:3-oxoacyl-[acyl-carrier protein] reductase